jgi:hypothetical protein
MVARYLLFTIPAMFLLSCDCGCPALPQYGISVHYVDSAGRDLFSADHDGQNGYWMDNVAEYDQREYPGQRLSCFSDNASQFQQLRGLCLRVCQNSDVMNFYSTTVIHVKQNMDDTVIIHLNGSSMSALTMVDSVWYNGVLKQYDSAKIVSVVK